MDGAASYARGPLALVSASLVELSSSTSASARVAPSMNGRAKRRRLLGLLKPDRLTPPSCCVYTPQVGTFLTTELPAFSRA